MRAFSPSSQGRERVARQAVGPCRRPSRVKSGNQRLRARRHHDRGRRRHGWCRSGDRPGSGGGHHHLAARERAHERGLETRRTAARRARRPRSTPAHLAIPATRSRLATWSLVWGRSPALAENHPVPGDDDHRAARALQAFTGSVPVRGGDEPEVRSGGLARNVVTARGAGDRLADPPGLAAEPGPTVTCAPRHERRPTNGPSARERLAPPVLARGAL